MKLKNLGSTLLATSMILCMAACTPGEHNPGGNKGKPTGSISITVSELGFGTQWLKNMAKEYESQKNIKVRVTPSYISGEIVSQLESETLEADIIMPLAGGTLYKFQDSGRFADLSDVYNTIPEGEDKAIKDKMNSSIYLKQSANKDGKIYQMNWIDSISTLIYNKSTLDKAFGEGNYTLPRTTDELKTFSDSIKAKGIYPFSYSTQVSYLQYAVLTWWAQYEGYEAYYDYYQGYYRDGEERIKDMTGENVLNMAGREKALAAATSLFSKSVGYSHNYCDAMSFTDAQIAFLGQGYKGKDKKEVAMMVNGDWIENEMATYLAYQWQDIRAMRMPMLSAIREKCPSIENDTELAALVEAIDNGGTDLNGTGYEVTQADFDRVAEARKMAYSATFDHPIAVTAESETQQKLAKDFLVFMASDKGQEIYSKQLNGMTQAYGYTPDASGMSAFAQSRRSLFDNYKPVIIDYSTPLYLGAGFAAFSDTTSMNARIYRGDSSADILKTTNDFYKSRWDEIISFAD